MGRKQPTSKQAQGTEFGGTTYNNGVRAVSTVDDLTAGEKRSLIVRTGQNTDPAAPARERHFQGQKGPKPTEPLPPRYMR